MGLVSGLEAGEFETLSDPFRKLIELEWVVEHDSGAAIAIPPDLALDRSQALDDDDHLLAHAIFLDRLDLHAPKRNVVHVHAVIELADLNRSPAADFEARRASTEAVARLAPGEQLAKV